MVLFLAAAAALVGTSRWGTEEEGLGHFFVGWMQPSPSSSSPAPSSLVLDGDLVDKIWSLCLQDVVSAEEILGIGQSFTLDGLSSRSSEDELKTMLLMELLAILPPQKSYVTHDCINAHYFSLGIAQELNDGLSNYVENQQPLLGSNFYPRRQLAHQVVGDAPTKSPAFAPAILSGGEAWFPLSVAEPPFAPPNSPKTNPSRHHDQSAQKHRRVPPPISSSEKQHNYIRLVLTVVLPTAAFSFIVAFLIFYCCGCNKSKVSVSEPRDDHPLLHLQLANASGEAIFPFYQPTADYSRCGILSDSIDFICRFVIQCSCSRQPASEE